MRLSILLIKEDENSRRTLQRALEFEGFPTIPVKIINEALSVSYEQIHLGLIIADVPASPSFGYDTVAKIKQHEVLRKIPLLAITTGDNDEPTLNDADVVIRKPFDLEILFRVVRLWCLSPVDPNRIK